MNSGPDAITGNQGYLLHAAFPALLLVLAFFLVFFQQRQEERQQD